MSPVEKHSDELILVFTMPHDLNEAVVESEKNQNEDKKHFVAAFSPDEWSGRGDESRGEHARESSLEEAESLAEQRVELLEVSSEDFFDHILGTDQGEIVEPAREQLVRDLHLLVLNWYQGNLRDGCQPPIKTLKHV